MSGERKSEKGVKKRVADRYTGEIFLKKRKKQAKWRRRGKTGAKLTFRLAA